MTKKIPQDSPPFATPPVPPFAPDHRPFFPHARNVDFLRYARDNGLDIRDGIVCGTIEDFLRFAQTVEYTARVQN